MSKAYKCDRCKKLYEKNNLGTLGYRVAHFGAKLDDVDLCPECTDTFIKWLQNKIQLVPWAEEEKQ